MYQKIFNSNEGTSSGKRSQRELLEGKAQGTRKRGGPRETQAQCKGHLGVSRAGEGEESLKLVRE